MHKLAAPVPRKWEQSSKLHVGSACFSRGLFSLYARAVRMDQHGTVLASGSELHFIFIDSTMAASRIDIKQA